MKEIYNWQVSQEELQIIKLALQGKISKRSHLWDKAQAIAEDIKVDVTSFRPDANHGLTENIKYTLRTLGKVTVAEIAEYLGVEVNSVSSITSRLYKNKEIKRESLPETFQRARKLQTQYSYYLD